MHEQLGPYMILGKLAAGGMATVYVGRHTRLENVVAIKVLHPHYQQDEQLRTRFVDEAKIQANLRHTNILAVQDILELPEASAMVMEMLSGSALDTYYRKVGRRLSVPHTLWLFQGLLEALAHAHEQGVVHRDLKPSNVFLHCQKKVVEPKLMDFGIAKLQSHALQSQVTAAGAMLGTPQYMAPEQFEDSSKVDARADQFALGVMLYEALVGEVPFGGENVAEIMKGILTATPVRPRERVEGIPEALDTLVMRCLEKDKTARYESAAALAEALDAVAEEVAPEPIPLAEVPRTDLREQGIDITAPITSSKEATRPEVATEQARPNGAPSLGTGTGADDDSWHDTHSSTQIERVLAKGRKRRWKWLVVILLLLVAGGAAGLYLWSGKGVRTRKKAKGKATQASSSPAAVSGKEAEPEVVPPLGELPHREGLALGSWCGKERTGLVRKVVEARMQGGWRGHRLSRLPEEQLNELGVGLPEQERFRELRAADAQVREIDRLAIAASVKPFKTRPLTEKNLADLAGQLAGDDELRTYVEAKAAYLCRSLPLTVAGRDQEVGALYQQVRVEFALDAATFSRLDATYDSDRLVGSEAKARAVCCLLAKLPAE